MMRTRFSCVALLALLVITLDARAGGVLFNFDQVQAPATAGVKIDDQRSEKSKKGGRPGLMLKPMTYLEDAAFAPGKVSQFEAAVAAAYATPPQHVVLKSFDVLDSYAKRMGAPQGATVESVSPAAAAVLGGQSPDQDYILCFIEAEVDGKLIAVAAAAPYRGNAMAFNPYKDPPVVAAVKQAVTDALRNWTERAKAQ